MWFLLNSDLLNLNYKFCSFGTFTNITYLFIFSCKKYPSMELRGLFQYLVNQLKKGIGIELVLLQVSSQLQRLYLLFVVLLRILNLHILVRVQELIQQMANMQYTENMTEEQLDAMSGSETLRYQATLFGMTRNNKVYSHSAAIKSSCESINQRIFQHLWWSGFLVHLYMFAYIYHIHFYYFSL